jgi:hypothetical protein
VELLRQYADRLDLSTRRTLGMAVGTLSTSLDAAAWVSDSRATLRTRAPTGDAALDAVNAVDATEPASVISSNGLLREGAEPHPMGENLRARTASGAIH